MKRKIAVLLVIIGFIGVTSFIAFEKYFGSFKSEIPGKWEIKSGEACFSQVRFFGGAGESKTIKLYEMTDDVTNTYNGKYHIEGDTIFAQVMKDGGQESLEMAYEQSETKLELTYTWQGEERQCIYEYGVE